MMTRVNSLKIIPILDWVLHIYYTHFRRKSPICFTIDPLIFLAINHQDLDTNALSACVEQIAETPKQNPSIRFQACFLGYQCQYTL